MLAEYVTDLMLLIIFQGMTNDWAEKNKPTAPITDN